MALFDHLGVKGLKLTFPEIIPNSSQTEQYRIPRNSAAFRDTEFRIIPRNFGQFRIAYGICGSKKNIRNSVLTKFWKHPTFKRGIKTFFKSSGGPW
jgi:hypothetical protein